MKSVTIGLTLLFWIFKIYGQQIKPVIDSSLIGTWPIVMKDAVLSQDGRYIAFTVRNYPVGSNTMIIQSVTGTWKKEITSTKIGSEFYFSSNSKKFCWQKGDSLILQDTDGDASYAVKVVSTKSPRLYQGDWMIYFVKGAIPVMLNLNSGKSLNKVNLQDAVFSDSGKGVLLKCIEGNETILEYLDLDNGQSYFVFKAKTGTIINSFKFDEREQLAFLCSDADGTKIYSYRRGMPYATECFNDKSNLLQGRLRITGVNGFSRNGRWLFIDLERPKEFHPTPNKNLVPVDIWTYRDEVIYPEQGFEGYRGAIQLVLNVEISGSGMILNDDGTKSFGARSAGGDYSLLFSDTIKNREYWWPHSPEPRNILVSLSTGKRSQLPAGVRGVKFSPDAKFLIYWAKDTNRYDHYSYEIATGKIRNLTRDLAVSIALESEASLDSNVVGVAGWVKDDGSVLIYDNYDIWKIDPLMAKRPLNITKSFGSKNFIKLRFLDDSDLRVYSGTDQPYLSGYNETTKYNGFLQLKSFKGAEPTILSMDPFSWYKKSTQIVNSAMRSNLLIRPLEAGKGKTHVWVLMGESATAFPNYFYTRDLKKFIPITDFQPQKKCNWLTAELVSWKMYDGKMSQGILYKPENFDSTKKYPLLFNYYERYSGWLYSFQKPFYSDGKINIPWFVSRGYMVFTPDIHFAPGNKTGISNCEYAYNSVISAAEYLSERPYVDRNHMAIQGISFGGLITNYLLTHSNLFAAAAESAGFSDQMSDYLTLIKSSRITDALYSKQSAKELDHGLYGTHPWDVPNLYKKSSPIWDADKASAPLLIMHNKNDEQVPWNQAVEMYMAMRRLGKPCWMLQYDNGDHGIGGKDAKDFTVRLTQYFDHYLKQAPAPLWMTAGIPARLKQIETGYSYDPSGNCSQDCKVCKIWNSKMANDSSGTWNQIEQKKVSEHWQ